MGFSWSAMRKILEQENICDCLKGRIQYFATCYRKSHDELGRISVRLDGNEVFKSCYYDYDIKRHEAWDEINISKGRGTSYWESGEEMELGALVKGGISQYSFYDAFYIYNNSSIVDSLGSVNPVVRLFAILDKRVGKRTLEKIFTEIKAQPEWLQAFYKLRLEADGIIKIPSISQQKS